MLVNNGKQLFKVCGTYNGTATGLTDWHGTGNLNMNAGAFRDAVYNPYRGGVNTTGSFIVLGDSDTAEAVSQYSIQGTDITSSLTRVGYTRDDNQTVGLTVTYRNDGSANVVIKEMAYFVWAGYDSTNSIMVARKVFAQPLTIEPNETRAVTITLAINP